MSRFRDKTVVVTGAGSGIGAATSRHLADEGAAVVLVDVREDAVRRETERITATGGQAAFVTADVASEQDWHRVAAECHDRFGPAHVLHSNAYVHRPGLPDRLDPVAWDEVIGVNLGGLYLGVRTFAADLRERHGSIVATSSVHALFGIPGYSAYAASKGAIVSLTRQLAVEMAPDVRVNCILPGPVLTGVWDPDDADRLAEGARSTAVGRLGTPEEIAAAVAFLASDEASFITGSSLVIDGGWTAKKDSP